MFATMNVRAFQEQTGSQADDGTERRGEGAGDFVSELTFQTRTIEDSELVAVLPRAVRQALSEEATYIQLPNDTEPVPFVVPDADEISFGVTEDGKSNQDPTEVSEDEDEDLSIMEGDSWVSGDFREAMHGIIPADPDRRRMTLMQPRTPTYDLRTMVVINTPIVWIHRDDRHLEVENDGGGGQRGGPNGGNAQAENRRGNNQAPPPGGGGADRAQRRSRSQWRAVKNSFSRVLASLRRRAGA